MYEDLDVLFLGGLFPKELEDEIIKNSIGNIQNAANNLQWEIVKGLDYHLKAANFQVINSMYIGSYPKRYKKLLIKQSEFSLSNSSVANNINIGFTNLMLYKKYSQKRALKKRINEWLFLNQDKKKIVIAYAMTSTFTSLLKYIKKSNPEITTCLIVPDLPMYMNIINKNPIYLLLKNLDVRIIQRNMQFIDCYTVLTEQMIDYLDLKVPTIVLEGIATDDFPEPTIQEKRKVLLYTGGINEEYGVLKLVEAFKKISDMDATLILCGDGNAKGTLQSLIHDDPRITYLGLLSRKEILKLQQEALVLVNPRCNSEDFTKYSFPSKILEYMASGTPVLTYKLDGMPNEYIEYIYLIKEIENGLEIALKEILLMDEKELMNLGMRARDFVVEEKNSFKQTEKILKLASSRF